MEWTMAEMKEAERLYIKFDIEYCCEVIGRSKDAIERILCNMGVKSGRPNKQRLIFAEDVANMIELKSEGNSLADIAKCFNTNASSIGVHISKAKKHGFDKYPKRPIGENNVSM